MYIQVNENDFCGLEEKLPIRVYVILNNKSFEKKCFSKTFLFANGSTYDGTGTVFMYEGKIMLWEEFLKNLEREILISNEIPVFKIEKI